MLWSEYIEWYSYFKIKTRLEKEGHAKAEAQAKANSKKPGKAKPPRKPRQKPQGG